MMKRGMIEIAAIVGLVIAVIVMYTIAMPVTNSLIGPQNVNTSSVNVAGYPTAQLISNQLPTFIGLTVLVTIASVAIMAFR